MKGIINTFKHGDKAVKCVLLLTILSGLSVAALLVTAALKGMLVFFFAAVIMLFVTISLAQTMGIRQSEEIKYNNEQYTEKEQYVEREQYTEKEQYAENEQYSEKEQYTEREQYVEPQSDMEELNQVLSRRKKEKKSPKIKLEIEEPKEKFEVADISNAEPITEEDVKSYTKKKIKKTLHKFKVKRDHRKVMIDYCEKLNIKQTPAFIWLEGNYLQLLLIEKEPRLVGISLYTVSEVEYLKKQPANEYSDYAIFKNSGILVDLFRPYLPDYTHSTVVDDMTSYKNLYGINGIYFTNNSAANLFDLLRLEFAVKDKVTQSNRVNVYFKEAYKANIKLRDNVLDANGYADNISRILDNLAKSTVSYNEFKETLNLMIKNKLITQEFANYYMDVRDKLSR